MADIKITQEMIDFYRSKPGNSVLLDSAIVDLIKKDIELGKLPKEFATLATDAQKIGYNAVNSNLFGYGFDSEKINNSQNIEFKYEVKEDNIDSKINNEYKGLFNSDGKISKVKQGYVGDCVLLADLVALSNNPIGKEYIKNAISYDKEGNIKVYFMGVDKTITVPKKHLYNPLGATGDIDASAIEKAVWIYIKQRQKDIKEGCGPDIIDQYYREITEGGFLYKEIHAFETGQLIYLLTGNPESAFFSNKDYEKLLSLHNKDNNKYLITTSFRNKEDHWYDFIKEQLGGQFGTTIVTNHAYSIKNLKKEEIIINNPWNSSKDLTYDINDLRNNYYFSFDMYNTEDFLKKAETTKNEYNGDTIIQKRRDGSIARTIEKNQQDQLVKIQTYDKNGTITACQEYKNGQKVKLTYYADLTEDYKAEKEGQLEKDWKRFTENKKVYYFENNKAIKVEIYYEDGSMEEKTENI